MNQKTITILGAGRSSTVLIEHLAYSSRQKGWKLRVGDMDLEMVKAKLDGFNWVDPFAFQLDDAAALDEIVRQSDVVISMVPASMHGVVAKACLAYGKHLLTASYNTDEIKAMHDEALAKGVLILMECGLDPGIDHMSAMKVIHRLRRDGHDLLAFETFTGGLLAPSETDDNPWQYRFTWNPRNVVTAGQGVVKFLQEGRFKYIPYHKLFRRTEIVHIPGYGFFEGYANRDSLKYREIYGLQGLKTLYRGTFRRPGFCRAWDIFVQLGATDDTYQMDGVSSMSHRQFINSFLSYNPHDSVELKLAHYLNLELDGEEMYKLKWLGIFDETPVGLQKGTPAEVLEHILKKKWTLRDEDKDMIVMWHKFDYVDGVSGKIRELHSHMVMVGVDQVRTGMAKTVGLPIAIAAEMLLEDKITLRGVHIPIQPEIYEPILDGLKELGVEFFERQIV
jgi:saccharopine dehydrogenase (NADP+, L-glutamate forming)